MSLPKSHSFSDCNSLKLKKHTLWCCKYWLHSWKKGVLPWSPILASYADILGALSCIPCLCSRLPLAASGEPFKPHARPINDCFCHEIPLSLGLKLRKYKHISHDNKCNNLTSQDVKIILFLLVGRNMLQLLDSKIGGCILLIYRLLC